ncbi:transglutaminase-like domain-containing protein [Paraliomyxa miuraensis]|uniref:transglutaminase-like domain-containing protein n=1 Tax=Paraliomyxa miuraensis TaxID=376150 RepID=UPI00224FCA15|nr:transglutaminase-like domain-containing protein [Paraliomyxa miuraensis]MCX4245519.1 transglutaminase-like domain-containing protein [Paraliomyxa miuraensis]
MTGRVRVHWGRIPLLLLRLLVLGGAAGAVTFGVVGSWGVVAAVVGTVLGAVLGQVVSGSRVRLPLLLLGAVALWGVGALVARLSVTSPWLVDALGPSSALRVATAARFGAGAAALAAALRMMAARVPALLGVELAAIVVAVVLPLASHRDGLVERPLWLSDWAWHLGYDPAHVLLAIGGAVAVVVGGLLMARGGDQRVSPTSWAGLLLLVLLGVSMVDVAGLPKPQAGNDLGLTGNEEGDDPLPTDPGNWPGGSRGEQRNEGKGGGARPEQGEGKGGGARPEQGEGKGGGGQPEQGEGKGGGGQPQQGEGKGGGGQPQQGEGKGGGGQPQQGEGKGGQPQESKGGGGQPQQGEGKGGGGQPPPEPPRIDDDTPPSGGSPAPMAVVLFGDDYTPPSGGFYFRQDVWSHWNGSRLVDSRRPDVDRDVPRSFPSTPTEVVEPPPEEGRQTVTGRVFLAVKHNKPFALEGPASLAPERNPEPSRFVRAYRFESRAQTIEYPALAGRASADPTWTEDVRDYYVRTPEDSRYAALAEEIVAALPEDVRGDPFAQALAIKLWLDEHITYSTAERHAGAADPTADFLFGSRIGYCVHIAHAAVMLWRSRGIAARVGAGYHGSPDDLRGAALVLRSGDAHAWPELYLEGVGWIVLDIAPQQSLDPPPEPGDDDLTEQLAELARSEEGTSPNDPTESTPKATPGLPMPRVLLAVLLAMLVGLYLVKLWRRLAPLWTRGPALPRVAYRRALDQLAEVGIARQLGETRTSFAARARNLAPSLPALAALSEAALLGNPMIDPRARPELQRSTWFQALRTLSHDLRAHVPARRRLLGLINPISFWQVR